MSESRASESVSASLDSVPNLEDTGAAWGARCEDVTILRGCVCIFVVFFVCETGSGLEFAS